MRLLTGLFIIGSLTACASNYKPGDHVCFRGMDLGAVETLRPEFIVSLPTDARKCN